MRVDHNFQKEFRNNKTFISKNLFSLKALKMLYYVLIENSEGIDESEGLDVVSTTELKSKNCITCRFYYYCSKNFRYEKNICDGCYHCIMYENENPSMIFRILTVKEEK